MPSLEAIITLQRELANDVLALGRVAGKIAMTPDRLRAAASSDSSVTAAAFELHNYYSVSENLMRRVAVAFENALDPGEWHRQLLGRMCLDIPGIRPALMDTAVRARLDELRKFRHFFRNAYDRHLDPAKVAEILEVQLRMHETWVRCIERFMAWLGDLARRLGESR
jgi:malonyl CoA-acyl carrier protein transacylase